MKQRVEKKKKTHTHQIKLSNENRKARVVRRNRLRV